MKRSFEIAGTLFEIILFICFYPCKLALRQSQRHFMNFPSKCLFKWIKRIISKSVHAISKILFILGSYKFLACLECISKNGLSFGYSNWHPSNVVLNWHYSLTWLDYGEKLQNYTIYKIDYKMTTTFLRT